MYTEVLNYDARICTCCGHCLILAINLADEVIEAICFACTKLPCTETSFFLGDMEAVFVSQKTYPSSKQSGKNWNLQFVLAGDKGQIFIYLLYSLLDHLHLQIFISACNSFQSH